MLSRFLQRRGQGVDGTAWGTVAAHVPAGGGTQESPDAAGSGQTQARGDQAAGAGLPVGQLGPRVLILIGRPSQIEFRVSWRQVDVWLELSLLSFKNYWQVNVHYETIVSIAGDAWSGRLGIAAR